MIPRDEYSIWNLLAELDFKGALKKLIYSLAHMFHFKFGASTIV
jgi:hypothetical protein